MTVCGWCGTTVQDVPPTWTRQVSERAPEPAERSEWLCDRCTRENLRSIEGRLDAAWW